MRKFLHILVIGLVLPVYGWSQVPKDSLNTLDDGFDPVIEDAIIDLESDDQVDFTIFTDYLEDLKRKPLDLNFATKDQLVMLPGIDDIIANNLLSYIEEFA